ncbi:tRNA threonylcarbamoyladenosine biosynthesis protein TsaB [Rickettsiales endosymbiont of Paramecium tredecaurelia]|uniref:tRNA (adenosine(37)-N6)-threonylcarbamoyltransferase complex dimerization subunit type 1 TsaB n=1 Tax=Candidatus Sarmatiella mevalonica TaxID=2770581 RepID=UPI001924A2FF|nr:tRNA (adenosine(37)-N6)-threonylcarbamoyltransferase complex dimerization subunit type 1 TsaB [Candidatus Sarmatiella mevalonica]MBL3284368.1 tRNA threonylcarbamoyladenosine biosynthesis protein TsaB [Candidatus Sarmatiella mevalonica]
MHNFKNQSILGFDVSNNIISISCTINGKLIAYFEDMRFNMQAELFVQSIDSLLSKHGLSYQDFQYLGFTNGPGSFTGIRIGLAFAAGVQSLLPDMKLVSVTNFDLAHYRAVRQVRQWDKTVILLDAYRNQLYYQIFDRNIPLAKLAHDKQMQGPNESTELRAYMKLSEDSHIDSNAQLSSGVELCKGSNAKNAPSIIDISNFSHLVEQIYNDLSENQQNKYKILFVGSGVHLVYQDIKRLIATQNGARSIQILPRFPIVKSSYICKYIEYCLQENIELNFNLEPLYIRHPDAKIQC